MKDENDIGRNLIVSMLVWPLMVTLLSFIWLPLGLGCMTGLIMLSYLDIRELLKRNVKLD